MHLRILAGHLNGANIQQLRNKYGIKICSIEFVFYLLKLLYIPFFLSLEVGIDDAFTEIRQRSIFINCVHSLNASNKIDW